MVALNSERLLVVVECSDLLLDDKRLNVYRTFSGLELKLKDLYRDGLH